MGRSRKTHAGRASREKQDRFVRLIAQGGSNSEACRQVGINRWTGTRWRFGRRIHIPASLRAELSQPASQPALAEQGATPAYCPHRRSATG